MCILIIFFLRLSPNLGVEWASVAYSSWLHLGLNAQGLIVAVRAYDEDRADSRQGHLHAQSHACVCWDWLMASRLGPSIVPECSPHIRQGGLSCWNAFFLNHSRASHKAFSLKSPSLAKGWSHMLLLIAFAVSLGM